MLNVVRGMKFRSLIGELPKPEYSRSGIKFCLIDPPSKFQNITHDD